MSEAVATTPVCRSCGADVREESLFCYNCGKAVRLETADPETAVAERNEEAILKDAEPTTPAEAPTLKSAASLRKKRRAMNRQPVQVSWEAPVRTPVAFYIVSVTLTIAAVVLIILALYLR